tara:strand:- start:119058 stop:119687 length:630 start_codon:yes stop_codon:yes gene_type:complete
MKLLLVGATGLVGHHVLQQALNDPDISKIVVLTRSAIEAHPKLDVIDVDFDNLPQSAAWWDVDSVICTLGTTMRNAKTKTQFRRVDYDYPLAIASMARQHGATSFVLNSSMGANVSSRFFYNQVKGEIEAAITQLNYPSLTIVRPGLIEGKRNEKRLGEQLMLNFIKVFAGLIPKSMQANPARNIAHHMIEAALQQKQGITFIRAKQLR